MTRTEMLATFFTHDGGDTSKWRLMGREYVGIELKPSYFREACRNLADAERQKHQTTLF